MATTPNSFMDLVFMSHVPLGDIAAADTAAAVFAFQMWSHSRHHGSHGHESPLAKIGLAELAACNSHADVFRHVAEARESASGSVFQSLGRGLATACVRSPVEPIGATGIPPPEELKVQTCVEAAETQLSSIIRHILHGDELTGQPKRQERLKDMLSDVSIVPPRGAARSVDEDGHVIVLGEGLAFCMASPEQQWFRLIHAVIRYVVKQGQVSLQDAIVLMIHLAQLRHDEAYPFPKNDGDGLWGKTAHTLLARLSDFGLVYPFKPGMFVVTRFISEAILTAPHGGDAAFREGTSVLNESTDDTIITETNFRVYAYTRNGATRAILEQFTEDTVVLDDYFVSCRITRDSFVAAVRRGLTAAQVTTFLNLKAHPATRKTADGTSNPSPVPHSVAEQLQIWESECNRVNFVTDCVLLSAPSLTALAAIKQLLGDSPATFETDSGHGMSIVVSRDIYFEKIAPHLPR